jgi:tRNA A-37 threonylcarbamoyl transferase component Bud32
MIGPYRVLGKLGEGGMAAVYRVLDPHVQRELALKLIRLDSGESTTALERFIREAEILARVQHPNVVRVHRLDREPSVAYLVQEIVEGETLEDAIRRGPLDPQRAARVVRPLADALAAIHREGILHRDLKPANVVLRASGEPVLLDFGIARDLNAERLTQTGAVLGTPSYMAPEQAAGEGPEVLGTFTDVYGLGAILYELLTGQPPFSGSPFSVIKAVLTEDPKWPSDLGVEIEPDLEGILRKAMQKEGSDRYSDAEALREDLDAFLAGRPTQAGGPPPPARKGPLIGAALSLLVLAGLAVGAWVGNRGQPTPTPTVSAEPTTSRSRRPARDPRLWRVEPGQHFVYILEFEERGGIAHTYMKSVLDVQVSSVVGDWAHLKMKMRSLRAGMRVLEEDLGPRVQAEPVDEASFGGSISAGLTRILESAKSPVEAEVNVLHGGVRNVRGFDEIGRKLNTTYKEDLLAIEAQVPTPDDQPTLRLNLVGNLQISFSDYYMEQAMDLLLNRKGRSITWSGHGGRTRYVPQRKADSPLLDFHLNRSGGLVELDGALEYQDGRLAKAQISQSKPNGSPSPDTWLRWSLLPSE